MPVAAIDWVAAERDYRSRSFADGLAAFTAARSANLARLRALPVSARARRGRQDGVGAITLGDIIPRMMREHDDSHRAEIATLLAGRTPPEPPLS